MHHPNYMKYRDILRAVAGGAIASLFLLCSQDYLEPASVPFTVRVIADSVVSIHDTLKIRFSVPEPGVWGVKYVWYFDSLYKADTTIDTLVLKVCSVEDTGLRRIVVKGLDGTGRASPENVFYVEVSYFRPVVELHADTAAPIHTPYSLRFTGYSAGSPVAYYSWFIDNSRAVRTTAATLVSLTWGVSDTGRRVIIARAVDQDGIRSEPCSLRVTVTCRTPAVQLHADTVGYTGASYTLRISAAGFSGRIDRYVWYIDDPQRSRTILDTLLTWVWGAQDTGRHVIGAYAIDRDSITSNTAVLGVSVLSGAPNIEAIPDTTISSDDTLLITCHASDPNGSIALYLWDFSGINDSTTDSTHALSYRGNRTERVTVGARDNDGLVSTTGFTVTFDRPLDTLAVSSPGPADTLVFHEKESGAAIAFTYNASDPDNDVIAYSLWWRVEADTADQLLYQGTDRSFSFGGIGPGRYLWRLEALDPWGHSRMTNGGIVVLREHTICFVGHSVVLGLGGSDSGGGFRAGVLDSLRRMLGPYEQLKPVGPMTSNWFMTHSPADDSCLAVSGIPSDLLYFTMINIPSLNADIWVLMSGVNDYYNPKGIRFTTYLMDCMYGRNPNSRIFVLNANQISPIPTHFDANYWQPYFNQGLSDSIAVRVAAGARIFQVDAFTALSDSLGQFDPLLFNSDGLHPDQTGYDRLRDAIFSTMKSSVPPVFTP
jgi:hypothetical protein